MSELAQRAGTIIVRGEQIVYASDGFAALVMRALQELVSRPASDLLVPEDRARVAELRARRARGEPVPRTLELTLLLPGGARRLVEAHLDEDGPETIIHVRDLGAQAARRLRLDAVAAIGAAIRGERTVEAVHTRVRYELEKLGLASAVLAGDGRGVRILWLSAPQAIRTEFSDRTGNVPEGYVGAWTPFAEKVRSEGAAFTDDWGAHVSGFLPPGLAQRARARVAGGGFDRAIGVRVTEDGGTLQYLVVAGSWLRSDDLPAVRLFGAQVAAALDAARTISDLSTRNAQLAVLNRVAELAGEVSDLPGFFARASEAVRPTAGYGALALYVLDEPSGELVQVHAEGGPPTLPAAAASRIRADSPLRDVLRERTPRAVANPYPGGDRRVTDAFGHGGFAWVPLVARSRAVGMLTAWFEDGPAAAAAALDLLSAVGAHFASAIESQRLLGDLRRRLGELTLLNDVARASAQLDPVLLLDAALPRVCETLRADVASAHLRDGERLVLVASAGISPACARDVAELQGGAGAPPAAVARREPVTGGSWEEAFGTPCHGPCRLDAFVAVPLLATGEAVGTLVLGRHRAEPFSPGEVALLSSVGVQLGVAVNAARLFAGVRRRLADLEAIHALALRVLSGAPGDVRSLLRDACREIARALSARSAVVFLAEDGGATLRAVASAGSPAMPEGLAFERARDAISDEVMRRREPVLSDDLTRDPRSVMNGFDVAPHAAVAVPLASRSAVRGVVFVADLAGRAFSPADVALANALAGELGVGLDNAELVEETRRRAEELGLVNEVGRSLAQTLDIEQLLLAGVRNLARIVDAPAAYLALASDDGKELELRAVSGAAGGGARDRIPADGATAALAQLVYQRREPVLVDDAANDPRVGEDMRRLSGARAYLGLPLVVRDRTIGTAVIVETRRPRRFTPAEVERAASIANQLAVAAENARLYEDLRRSYAQLERAQQQVVQGERLAALGELSAVVAHEVRNPLGVIFNSIGSLRRLVPPVGDAKLLIDIVGEEAERLNRIVGDLLDFAHPSQPQLRPEPIARVAEDAIGAALSPEGSRVEVVRELDPALPPVALDARLFRQAVLNIAVNAVQAMPRGGRITLRTRRDGEHAVVEIEDTGPGIPEEVRARIFEPFFTTKATGTGLGLAVVRRIVEGHGGEVSLRSAAGSGTVFSLRLAIAGPATVENLPGLRSDRRP